jgi:hypothetical protein
VGGKHFFIDPATDDDEVYRRVDETDGPLAKSKSSIIDHREDGPTDWRRARRSEDALELTINLRVRTEVCKHNASKTNLTTYGNDIIRPVG